MGGNCRNDSIAIINGTIYTMSSPERCAALYAEGGVIKALGSDKEILQHCGSRTAVLDMRGKYVMPGMTDTHCHLLSTGRSLEEFSLRTTGSIAELVRAGRKNFSARKFKEGEWFYAYGWDQNNFAEGRFPNRRDLDKISMDVPISFERSCGRIISLNSKALEILGIDGNFNVPGGYVERGETGELTGVVAEAAADRVRAMMPDQKGDRLERWYKLASDQMVQYGITAVQTDDIGVLGSAGKVFSFYENEEGEGKMPLRVTEQWRIEDETALEDFIARGSHKRGGKNYFSSGPLKIHVDGTLGSRTAALREDYCDMSGGRGVSMHSCGELAKLTRTALDAGMGVAFTAIGDAAIERCLEAVEAASENASALKIPCRIIHCQVGALDLYKRMCRLGVAADIQPAFVTSDWPIILSRLGADRARYSYAWESLLRAGITVGAGSDSPAEPLNPFIGVYSAVSRKDGRGFPEHGWMPVQRLTRREAFLLYTLGGARVCGEDAVRGTLAVGKKADFAAFMRDPFEVGDRELMSLKAGLTVIDGKIAYIK